MEKLIKMEEDMSLLMDQLYHLYPYSSDNNLSFESASLLFLDLLEKYDPKRISEVFKIFIKGNRKYSESECFDIIDHLIFNVHMCLKENTADFNLDTVSDKLFTFIDIFNSYGFSYEMQKDIGLEFDRLKKIIKQLNSNVNDIDKRYTNISDKINKINYDFIGTISLFIGVIFAIYGGFELSTSVFKYIGSIDFKYLIIALIVLGYIEFSIVSLLVHVIFKINNKKDDNIFGLNIMFFIFMILLILLFYFL